MEELLRPDLAFRPTRLLGHGVQQLAKIGLASPHCRSGRKGRGGDALNGEMTYSKWLEASEVPPSTFVGAVRWLVAHDHVEQGEDGSYSPDRFGAYQGKVVTKPGYLGTSTVVHPCSVAEATFSSRSTRIGSA